jgi:hypothetical protein
MHSEGAHGGTFDSFIDEHQGLHTEGNENLHDDLVIEELDEE